MPYIFDLRLVINNEKTAAHDIADALRLTAERIEKRGLAGVLYTGSIQTPKTEGHYLIAER